MIQMVGWTDWLLLLLFIYQHPASSSTFPYKTPAAPTPQVIPICLVNQITSLSLKLHLSPTCYISRSSTHTHIYLRCLESVSTSVLLPSIPSTTLEAFISQHQYHIQHFPSSSVELCHLLRSLLLRGHHHTIEKRR
jgi:hypothetical protein